MSEKKVPERRCIGCMQSKPKSELIRIVASDDGLHIDISGKMPASDDITKKWDSKKNAFGRNLKTEISRQQAESLAEQIAQLCR